MKAQLYHGKKIIREGKGKRLLVISVCFLLALIAVFNYQALEYFKFWSLLSFFGGGGIFLTIQFINPHNLFVKPGSILAKEIAIEQANAILKDLGCLSYSNDGFEMKNLAEAINYKWTNIQAVFAYKLDLLTTDEICMDIFFDDDSRFVINESTPGWFQFNENLNLNILAISPNWQSEVILPPFKTNHTLLYDKKGRSKDEAIANLYAAN
jgi:hypothetical protein